MKTELIKLTEKNLQEAITTASKIIQFGGLVAFPTETVYGLGANALDKESVKKIFIAKGRPQDNPLIVHIADKKDLKKYVLEIPKKAEKLINKFWPGPLTIVLKKKQIIPDIVTCGLDSVAIRMPSNKIALALIKNSKLPIAAPSANTSGKPSSTKAEYVFDDLNEKIDLILDGGDTDIGLESTVVSLVKEPVLLRPGKISLEQIEKTIGKIRIHEGVINKLDGNRKIESPGLKYKHYCPNAKVILVTGKSSREKIQELKNKYWNKKAIVILNEDFNKDELAKDLFSKFRDADKHKVEIIIIEGINETGIGLAIMNRLRRATSEIIDT